MVTYRIATTEDAADLAMLHKKYIHWGFITSLGGSVLRWVYHSLAKYDEGVVIIAEEGGKKAGFVSGVLSLKGYYNFFLTRYFFRVIPCLMVRLSSAEKMLEIFLYPKKENNSFDVPCEELLAIVVDEGFQGHGVASSLFHELKGWFSDRGVYRFKTTVGEGNARSIRFFKKMGCKEWGITEIHKSEMSRMFICE